jgi:hypothetical protein
MAEIQRRPASAYDLRLLGAFVALGGGGLTAAMIADKLGRPVRGMDASLRAAKGRVDWFEKVDGLWSLTEKAHRQVGREQLADELDAEELMGVR